MFRFRLLRSGSLTTFGSAPNDVSRVTTSCGISIGSPVADDPDVSSIAPHISNLRTNIPSHIRESLAVTKFATGAEGNESKWWSPFFEKNHDLPDHYKQSLCLAPHVKGQVLAYNWPNRPIPVSVAARVPSDLRIDPTEWGSKSVLLLDKLLGHKYTLLFAFSGESLSTPASGLRQWLTATQQLLPNPLRYMQIHFHSSWISRRTHILTKMLLKHDEKNTFIYRGKLTRDLVLSLHLYDKSLPTVLLVDERGYVRWHAVGLPSEPSLQALQVVANQL